MQSETIAFLDSLYARCRLPGYITFSALAPDGERATPSRHIPLGNANLLEDAFQRLIQVNALGWGACVGVATRRADLGRWRRGCKQELAEIPAIFLDVDNPDQTLPQLHRFELPPSCVVRSGRFGQHFYWYLSTPSQDIDLVDRVLRGLAVLFNADVQITCTHALRLPGTINHKYTPGAPCSILELHPERCYDIAQFSPYAVAPRSANPRQPFQRTTNSLSWEQASDGDLNPQLVGDISACLMSRFSGFMNPHSRWIRALCPLGHDRDRPGKHFGFCPDTGLGWCFGRHGGPLRLHELGRALRLDLSSYGWIQKRAAF